MCAGRTELCLSGASLAQLRLPAQPERLEVLFVDHNRLRSLNGALGGCVRLRELYAHANELTSLTDAGAFDSGSGGSTSASASSSSLRRAKFLTHLDLGDNQLGLPLGPVLGALSHLRCLRELRLQVRSWHGWRARALRARWFVLTALSVCCAAGAAAGAGAAARAHGNTTHRATRAARSRATGCQCWRRCPAWRCWTTTG
jgi:hypothetical protein